MTKPTLLDFDQPYPPRSRNRPYIYGLRGYWMLELPRWYKVYCCDSWLTAVSTLWEVLPQWQAAHSAATRA